MCIYELDYKLIILHWKRSYKRNYISYSLISDKYFENTQYCNLHIPPSNESDNISFWDYVRPLSRFYFSRQQMFVFIFGYMLVMNLNYL